MCRSFPGQPVATTDRWQHVERLYHAALACDESERAVFLRETCGDDEPLRREIESLLVYEGAAPEFMGGLAIQAVAAELLQSETRSRALVGQRLGPYQIGSLLGAGGMGDVYRARD